MIYIWFMPSYTCQQQIGRRPCVHPSKSQYSRSQYRMSPRLRQRKTAFHTRAPGRPNKKRGVLLIASRFGSKYGRGLVSLMKPPLYHSITRQTSILSNITIMPAARSCWLTRCVDLAAMPPYSDAQEHVCPPAGSTEQDPPFWQGLGLHAPAVTKSEGFRSGQEQ